MSKSDVSSIHECHILSFVIRSCMRLSQLTITDNASKGKSFASNHIFIWQCILKYFIFWNMYWIWPWNIVALFKIVSCCINFYIDEYTEKTNFNSVIDVRRAPLAGTSATIMMTYAVRTMQKRPSITIRNSLPACLSYVTFFLHIYNTHVDIFLTPCRWVRARKT